MNANIFHWTYKNVFQACLLIEKSVNRILINTINMIYTCIILFFHRVRNPGYKHSVFIAIATISFMLPWQVCTYFKTIVKKKPFVEQYFTNFFTIFSRIYKNLHEPFVLQPNNKTDKYDISFYGPSWPWSYGSWIYNYLCNLPITTKVVSLNPAQARCTRYNIMW